MAELIVITLERQGAKSIKPRPDERTHDELTSVPAGSQVKFVPAGGIIGTDITFKGRSPFGAQPVAYNVVLNVTAGFDAANRSNNLYKYVCHGKALDGTALDSDGGGGDVEIVRA